MNTKPTQTQLTPDQAAAMAKAWGAAQPYVGRLAGAFARRYGGHPPTVEADAMGRWCRAWLADPVASATDQQYIRRAVWYGLLDEYRVEARRRSVLAYMGDDLPEEAECGPVGEPGAWADTLGPDAEMVLCLVLSPPEPVARAARARGGNPYNMRSSLRDYLMGTEGWGARRVAAAFEEVGGALCATN
jgi:hypothetical protein